jgi:hypothetical protein
MTDKPHSSASERNREPILTVLHDFYSDRTAVLEIGSGTGQHAVHFAQAMPHLRWQASDRAENLAGIRAWLDEAALPNSPEPLELDVTRTWPAAAFDAVFSANTLHIMGWREVAAMFAALPAVTTGDAKLAIYGPFNIDGTYTSYSNAAFDDLVKQGDAAKTPQESIKKWQQAEDILAKDMPVIPLRFGQNNFGHSNNVTNVEMDLFDRIDLLKIEAVK